MQRIFLVSHLKRSGGHAVTNWLQESEKDSVFFNNDIPVQPVLMGSASLPDKPPSFEDWTRRKPPDAARAIARAGTLFVSVEDFGLDVSPFEHPAIVLIIILRDPENLFASRIRKASSTSLKAYDYHDPAILGRAVLLWKEHARVVLGLAHCPLPHIGVFYDAWLIGETYREALAKVLGLSTLQRPSGQMTSEGGGSSFADRTVDASSLRRRSDLLDEQESDVLRRIMSDPEMRELSAQTATAVTRLVSGGEARSTRRP